MEVADCGYKHSSSSGEEASSMVERQSANWALLPEDALQSILDKLVPEVSDCVRFASVCKDWLTAARNHQTLCWRRPIFPVLLIPADDKSETRRGWYNVVENKTINSRLRVPSDKRCCGCSQGWLIFPDETLALTLFNPSSGATIHLPPVSRVPTEEEIGGYFYHHEYEIQKVILSADPSTAPDSYEALAIIGDGKLALFKSGWDAWIEVMPNSYFEDATYFNGKFYAASLILLARLDICSGNSESYTQTRLIKRRIHDGVDMTYLVRTPHGRLLWVDRFYEYKMIGFARDETNIISGYFALENQVHDGEPAAAGYRRIDDYIREKGAMRYHFTSHFNVYEVKETQGKAELAKVKTLDDQILFLGHNDSEVVLAHDFPECKANCIYFMDDCLHLPIGAPYHPVGAIDIGVYDLDTHCCKQLDVAGPGRGYMPPPIWILPPKPNLETTFS